MIKNKNSLPDFLIPLFLFSFFVVFLLREGNLPFIGNNAWNFNTYALIAHNYTVFGWIDTRVAPVISVATHLPTSPEYYLHHPQLLSLIQSVFFIFLGESFFTARLPVLLATFFSLVFIYLSAKELISSYYARICLFIGVLLPGYVVFGRMIGQEALVMFFVSVILWSILKYLKTKKRMYESIAFGATILGTLSDWPMVYFVFFLFPFLLKKDRKLYLILFLTSVGTAGLFLLYSVWLSNGPGDLIEAFMNRSPGSLVRQASWYISWPFTILLRILLYFNPVVILLACLGTYFSYQNKRDGFFLFLSLLFFGFGHIVFYPEGSYGHAYWIYYLVPFVILTAAYCIYILQPRKMLILFGAFFLLYFVFIESWKYNEMAGNMYRFYFAREVTKEILAYQTAYVNKDGIFDFDMFSYQFATPVKETSKEHLSSDAPIILSCFVHCAEEKLEAFATDSYHPVTRIVSDDAEVFLLRKSDTIPKVNEKRLVYLPASSRESFFRNMFVKLKHYLQFPQL